MKSTLVLGTVFVSIALAMASCSSGGGGGETTDETDNTGGTVSNDGTYDVDVAVDAALGDECQPTDGELTVNNNAITGFVASGAGPLTVTGTIESDGSITGGFAFDGGAPYATYAGNVTGAVLSGTWTDQFGCNGTWSASRT